MGLIDSNYFSLLQQQNKTLILTSPAANFKLLTAGKSPLKILGSVCLDFYFHMLPYKFTFIVVSGLYNNLILGADFLIKNKSKINFNTLTLEMPSEVVKLQVGAPEVYFVMAVFKAVIPPFTEMIITGQTTAKVWGQSGVTDLICDPNVKPVNVLNTLVTPDKNGQIPIRVLNTTSSDLIVQIGRAHV